MTPEEITTFMTVIEENNVLLSEIHGYLTYICGIAIFGVIVILCRYVYKFFNLFF